MVGCISACMTLLIAIIKPLRQGIINSVVKKSQDTKRNTTINQMDKKMDMLLANQKKFEKRLDSVEKNVLDNEADRLRSELFDCGNRCRRRIRLHPEEMDHIRDVYDKYSKVLKQNGPGEKEFNFITDYYNNQDFPTYHEYND